MRLRGLIFSVSFIFLFLTQQFNAMIVGSNTAVSVEPFTTFPTGTSNQIIGFAWMKNGFELTDGYTTVAFDSNNPISGAVSLNGGTLLIETDLSFVSGSLNGSGTVKLGNNRLIFDAQASTFTDALTIEGNGGTVCLQADVTLSDTWSINGTVIIDGNGYSLDLGNTGEVYIASNASITFKNITLRNVAGTNIHCGDDTGTIVFNNTTWRQNRDYTFNAGQFTIVGKVNFLGAHTFTYNSVKTSTINAYSQCCAGEGFNFTVGRKTANTSVQPLTFTDETSLFIFDNADLTVNVNGMTLTKGTMEFNGNVNIEMQGSSASSGVILGTSAESDDFTIQFNSGSLVKLNAGYITYNNSTEDKVVAFSKSARLVRKQSSSIIVDQNCIFPSMTLELETDSLPPVQIALGKRVEYRDTEVVLPSVSFNFIGNQSGSGYYVLSGDDVISFTKGILPLDLLIESPGNILQGNGVVGGEVTLSDHYAAFTWRVNGNMANDITLNGSTLLLGTDLHFASGRLKGSGTVKLGNNRLVFGTQASTFTDSLTIEGNGGIIGLQSDVALLDTWSINGDVTIDGNGYSLDLGNTGEIYLTSNASVTFRNVTLLNVSGINIHCGDDTGTIVFNNTTWRQNGDYTFNAGQFTIAGKVDFLGAYTFTYNSAKTSTINSNSQCRASEGFNFTVGRKTANTSVQPLTFTDETSLLIFDNADLTVNANGMILTKGTMEFDGNVNIEMQGSSASSGVILGTSAESDDFTIQFNSGSLVKLNAGYITYNNATEDKLVASSKSARLVRKQSSSIVVDQNCIFPAMTLELETDSLPPVQIASGKIVEYRDTEVVLPSVSFNLTGNQSGYGYYVLSGDDVISFTKGILPLDLLIESPGNIFQGNGVVGGEVTLSDHYAAFTWQVNGNMANDIILNGGTLLLGTDLYFASGKLDGSGTLKLNENRLTFGPQTCTFNDALTIEGNGGTITLQADATLSDTWSINGEITIDGNGYSLDLGNTGEIYLTSNASVTFRNIILRNISGMNIRCVDDTGGITLDNVRWIQENDASFVRGTLTIINKVKMVGNKKSFTYFSSQASIIKAESTLKLSEGFIFKYQPGSTEKDLLVFESSTARLELDRAEFNALATGVNLTKGTIYIRGNSTFSADVGQYVNEGITIGDGTSAGDCTVCIKSGGTFTYDNGSLNYKNVKANSWLMESDNSKLKMKTGTTLRLYESLNLGKGKIIFAGKSTLAYVAGKELIGPVIPQGPLSIIVISSS